MYTITLWDLPTWTEVDVVIDERLAARPDGTGLLGCSPSSDGELWACYLEKAVAKHCGGWDEIDGGQCTHAWAILTGCRYQYNIRRKEDGKFYCFGKFKCVGAHSIRHTAATLPSLALSAASHCPRLSPLASLLTAEAPSARP